MTKEKVLVIGLGEVGLPIYDLLVESRQFEVYGLDTDPKKMQELRQNRIPERADTVHICIPCAEKEQFVNIVTDYALRFKPKLLIINSTVQPGTTIDLQKKAGDVLVAHSPIRGLHSDREHMKTDIKRWTKYIGGSTKEAAEAADRHLEKMGLKHKILRNAVDTELAKLFETTYRAWMIVCFQEMHRISRRFNADFDGVADFLEDTHRGRFDRPLMFPGVIGKHCLIPNVELLLNSYDSEFLKLILKSNKRREEEVEDKRVLDEIEKIQRRVERMQDDMMKLKHPRA